MASIASGAATPPGQSLPGLRRSALVVIDVQRGFDDSEYWGRRNNPRCEENIAELLAAFRLARLPVVFVRHDSNRPGSSLHPDEPGNAFKSIVAGQPDVLITKHVNSAFLGTPDLHEWLAAAGIRAVTICGITTNHCCETTARMAGNLGYETFFVLDATHSFDREGPDGVLFAADDLVRVTAANLDGEFARVVSTRQALAALRAP